MTASLNATRRAVLGMAAGGGSALLAAESVAAPMAILDFADPAQRLRTLVLMREPWTTAS